jgi:hypothetical protein
LFHETHGYYAQASTSTAVLTAGRRDRFGPGHLRASHTIAVGWCLERHDLWVSKAAAGREKDGEFCRALAQADLVDEDTCAERIAELSGAERSRADAIRTRAFR